MTEKSDFYVYVLFRLDGHPFYVGKGRRNRWLHHERKAQAGGSRKENVIVSILRAGREVPKIKVREGLTNAEAGVVEVALIAAIGRAPAGPLLNQTDGGDGCVDLSTEARERIGKKLRGRKLPPDVCAKMSAARAGFQLTAEARARCAATNRARGHKRTPEAKAKMRAAKLGRPGHPMPPALREKLRARNSYKRTPETCAKMSAAKRGRPWSIARRAKFEETRKGTES